MSTSRYLPLPVVSSLVPGTSDAVRECHRCGDCCRVIPLSVSPATLHALARGHGPQRDEARQIERALGGRCHGKATFGEGSSLTTRYIFGPCRNLVVMDDGLPVCAIHDIKPSMCRDFPGPHNWDGSFDDLGDNPGYIQGCGYNRDPQAGATAQEIFAACLPLEEFEQ